MNDDFLLNIKLRKHFEQLLGEYKHIIGHLKVDYIGYREFYDDGTSIGVCTNDRWYYIEKDQTFNEDMAVHYVKELSELSDNNLNFVIRTSATVQNRFLQALLSHDICNSLLVYKKHSNKICQYAFIASTKNFSALTFFVNNSGEFVEATALFQEDFSNLFAKHEYYPLRMPLFSKTVAKKLFLNIKLIEPVKNYGLTEREGQCASLLVYGATDKEISNKLGISLRTVESHISNIRKKLKVRSRFEASVLLKKLFKHEGV